MDNKKIILEMKGISKSFPGVKALDDVQLTVRELVGSSNTNILEL